MEFHEFTGERSAECDGLRRGEMTQRRRGRSGERLGNHRDANTAQRHIQYDLPVAQTAAGQHPEGGKRFGPQMRIRRKPHDDHLAR